MILPIHHKAFDIAIHRATNTHSENFTNTPKYKTHTHSNDITSKLEHLGTHAGKNVCTTST